MADNDSNNRPDFYSSDFVPECTQQIDNSNIIDDPRHIYEWLDERSWGMTAYKRALSTFVYRALKYHSSDHCILIAGESGTGKSFIGAHLLPQIIPNLITIDGSSVVASGYKGPTLKSALSALELDGDKIGFVIIDEANRLIAKCMNDVGWASSGLLAELLVLLDGGKVSINIGNEDKKLFISPSKLYWILLGSFSDITDAKSDHKPIGFNAAIEAQEKKHRPDITKEMILKHLEGWPELIGSQTWDYIKNVVGQKERRARLKGTQLFSDDE